jgi:hypothetical protein
MKVKKLIEVSSSYINEEWKIEICVDEFSDHERCLMFKMQDGRMCKSHMQAQMTMDMPLMRMLIDTYHDEENEIHVQFWCVVDDFGGILIYCYGNMIYMLIVIANLRVFHKNIGNHMNMAHNCCVVVDWKKKNKCLTE